MRSGDRTEMAVGTVDGREPAAPRPFHGRDSEAQIGGAEGGARLPVDAHVQLVAVGYPIAVVVGIVVDD